MDNFVVISDKDYYVAFLESIIATINHKNTKPKTIAKIINSSPFHNHLIEYLKSDVYVETTPLTEKIINEMCLMREIVEIQNNDSAASSSSSLIINEDDDVVINNENELSEVDYEKINKCIKYEELGKIIAEKNTRFEGINLSECVLELKKNYKSGIFNDVEVAELNKIKAFNDWRINKSKSDDIVKLDFEDGILYCRMFEKENKNTSNEIEESTIYRGVNIGTWLRRHKKEGDKDDDKLEMLKKIKAFRKNYVKPVKNTLSFNENVAAAIIYDNLVDKKSLTNKKSRPKEYTFIQTQKNRYKKTIDPTHGVSNNKNYVPLTNIELREVLKIKSFKKFYDKIQKEIKNGKQEAEE
jgi:hypothetical protein